MNQRVTTPPNGCRAVRRVLENCGLTYQDLTRYRRSRRKSYTFTPKQTATYRQMALRCRDADQGRLSPLEREFIAKIISWRRELTIPEHDRLLGIADKLDLMERGIW